MASERAERPKVQQNLESGCGRLIEMRRQGQQRSTGNIAEVWEELIVSILAVNNRSLEKTYALLPLLRKAGVVEPENLTKWPVKEVVITLKRAGIDWGSFMTELFAQRLVSLGTAVNLTGIAKCGEVLSTNDPDAIRNLLSGINGVGPKVLQNFFLFRGIKEKP
jgi:hypothetical protein